MNFPRIRVLSGILVILAAVLIYVATAPNTRNVPISSESPIPHIKHTKITSMRSSPTPNSGNTIDNKRATTTLRKTIATNEMMRPEIVGHTSTLIKPHPSIEETNNHPSSPQPNKKQHLIPISKLMITPKSTSEPTSEHRRKTKKTKLIGAMIDQFDLSPETIEQGRTATLCAGTEPDTESSVSQIGALRRGIISCFHVSPATTTTYRLTVNGRGKTSIHYRILTVKRKHPTVRHEKQKISPSTPSPSLTSP